MHTTELCKIAYKYGTDKTPLIKHSYTPYYHEWFNTKRNEIKKVLELGIGHFKNMQNQETIFDPGLNRIFHRGASLYMWRDFFPYAQIYGADIVTEALIQDERITSFYCDERNKDDLVALIKRTGSDIDIFIDDASHRVDDQIFTAKTVLPMLNKGATYIIEDVGYSKKISSALSDYNTKVQDVPRKWHGGMLFVINL